MPDRREYYRQYQKKRRADPELRRRDYAVTKAWYRRVKQEVLLMREQRESGRRN
jgi:hypothetical protein